MTLNKDNNSFTTIKKRNRIPQTLNKLPPLESYTNSVCKIKRYPFLLYKQDPKSVKICNSIHAILFKQSYTKNPSSNKVSPWSSKTIAKATVMGCSKSSSN